MKAVVFCNFSLGFPFCQHSLDFWQQYLNVCVVPFLHVFVKRKCEQKGPKKVSTFSTRFHVVSNAFPKYQMLTF